MVELPTGAADETGVGWAEARTSAFTRVFTRYGRAHAFLLGSTTWARRFRGFAHPTLFSNTLVA
jgi:hypothetical protein